MPSWVPARVRSFSGVANLTHNLTGTCSCLDSVALLQRAFKGCVSFFGQIMTSTFNPTYVHRAFRISGDWQRAAERIGLPGSSTRVFQILLAEASRRRRPLSRKSIHRMSGIPLSTVRDGVDQLLAAGWIEQRAGGVALKLEASSSLDQTCTSPYTATNSGTRGGRISPPMKRETEGKDMAPHTPAAPPAGPMPREVEELLPEKKAIAAELELAGCDPAGARAAAAVTTLDPTAAKRLLEDLRELDRKGQVRNLPAMAVWAVKRGKRAARSLKRQASRARGIAVCLEPASSAAAPRHEFMATFAQCRASRRAAAWSKYRGLEKPVRMVVASEIRLTLSTEGIPAGGARAWRLQALLEERMGFRA